MSRFPRIAPLTRPKPRVVKLPPLRVAVYRRGELARIEEIPDPRIALIREINAQGATFGFTARAVDRGDA